MWKNCRISMIFCGKESTKVWLTQKIGKKEETLTKTMKIYVDERHI
jgi:hypothetical protein